MHLYSMVEILDDIRKLYRFAQPCPVLHPFVEFYSETCPEAMQQYVGDAPFTVKMFPSYTPTIWINLGAPYQLRHGNDLQQVDRQTDVLVLRSGIVERCNLPSDNIFTIKFNPGGFEAIFGISQTTIGNEIVSVTQLIPAPLLRKLKRPADFNTRLQLVEQHLLDQYIRHRTLAHPLSFVRQAIDQFSASGMQLNNQQLASHLHLTEKTFYRYFTHAIGVGPKQFFATLRARNALTAWISQRTSFDHTAFGYYDQSHFYRDVEKFTGTRFSNISNKPAAQQP